MTRKDIILGAAAFAMGQAIGKPVRSMLGQMGDNFIQSRDEGWENSTAKYYVQDGLVALWDGIENAGWGRHDADIEEWKDLKGGESNFILSDTSIVEENKIVFPQNTSNASDTQTVDVKHFRFPYVEIVFSTKRVSWGDSRVVLLGNEYWGNVQSIVTSSPSGDPDGSRYIGFGLERTLSENGSQAFVIPNLSVVECGFKCGTVRPANINPVVNGQIVQYITRPNIYTTTTTDKWILCGAGSNEITIYCLRFYSRALNSDEVAHNYAIDKERFGL